MNDPEEHLRAARLAPPSADLDRRMNDAFAASVKSVPRNKLWWWLAALPLGAAATFFLLLKRPASEPPAPPLVRAVVYEIEPQGLMRDLLLTPSARLRPPPKLSVETPR